MTLIDKLKSLFGGLFGDIPLIENIKKQEADIYKAKEKVAKEEIEAAEALLEWANNQESESLKNAVELYYDKTVEIIEASKSMIEAIRNDYILPLESVAKSIDTFNIILNNQEKAQKNLEKAQRNLEKKKSSLEKEQNKPATDIAKINLKKAELETAEKEVEIAEQKLESNNKLVENTKIELAKYKFNTLIDVFNKLTGHQKVYLEKFDEIFKIRDNLISVMKKEVEIADLESDKTEDESETEAKSGNTT